ncbi:MAG: calcium-binding protein [Pseudomonadota bacterium]
MDGDGQIDLIRRISTTLFGANWLLTNPLPRDLAASGQEIYLDAGLSREAIVANARNDIAWRYALRELNPFVISNVSYAQHNTDGSLDLYDPATGNGTMTEAYLKDRAAMLAWLVRYRTGQQDDNDDPHDGPKPYDQDWDTSSVEGNWDFVDMSIGLGGNQHLTLAIDGTGTSLHDHQVVFGSREDDVIEGEGDTDRLYGGAGNDTLTGGDEADYLEGGAGNDTYVWEAGDGNDVILDTDGIGELVVNGQALTGGSIAPGTLGSTNFFDAERGIRYHFQSNTPGSSVGTLRISGSGVGSEDEVITIRNFRLDLTGTSDLGLTLSGIPGLKLIQGVHAFNPLGRMGYEAPEDPVLVRESQGTAFVLAMNSVTTTPRVVTLAAASDQKVAIVIAGVRQALGPGGIQLTIPAGESMVAFTIVQDGDIDESLDLNLTATFVSGNEQPDAVHSLTLHLEGDDEAVAGSGSTFDLATIPSGDPEFSAGNDHILGDGRTTVTGGDGNDLIEGNLGEEIAWGRSIVAGSGDDVVYAHAPGELTEEQLIAAGETATRFVPEGAPFNAVYAALYGDAGNDRLFGHTGDDLLLGGTGTDLLVGGGGNDLLRHDIFQNDLVADQAADTFHGGAGEDVLIAGSGDDLLYGGAGADDIEGGGGNDLALGGAGDDIITGDREVYRNGAADLALSGNDFLDGGADNDLIVGGGGDDALFGGAGHDRLRGGGAEDATRLDATDLFDLDTVEIAPEAWDVLYSSDNDYLDGEAGDDIFVNYFEVNSMRLFVVNNRVREALAII